MLRERGKFLRESVQTKFWVGAAVVFAMGVAIFSNVPLSGIYVVTEDTIPALVVIFSVLTTSVWSYCFLLVPRISDGTFKRNERGVAWVLFHVLFVIGFLVSLTLLGVYGYSVAIRDASTEVNLNRAFSIIPYLGWFLQVCHLFIYVLIYSCMDLIISVKSDDPVDKPLFCSIVMFVNVPILLTLIFISFIVRPFLETSIYVFESGVIAFQLIAGSLAVVGLEYLEKKMADMNSCAKGHQAIAASPVGQTI